MNAKSVVPTGVTDISKIFQAIKEGCEFSGLIYDYRASGDKSKKVFIPCYSPSGTFSKRSVSNISEYNGIVCIDIDSGDNPDVDFDELKNRIKQHDSILCVHKSVGGLGLAVYIRTSNKDCSIHSAMCKDYMNMFESKFNIKVDRACSDVSRLRFLSLDPDIYVNEDSRVVIVNEDKYRSSYSNNSTSSNIKSSVDGNNALIKLIHLVLESGIDITEDYKNWTVIGTAIANELGDSGRELFHAVSKAYHKYSFTECDKTFTSLLNMNKVSRPITLNSVFSICAEYGIMLKDKHS